MDNTETRSDAMVLEFKEDRPLTEMMRLRCRLCSAQDRSARTASVCFCRTRVYRLDFPTQTLKFSRWYFSLTGYGRVTITGVCQLWTPDLTPLMTRQLLEPIGTFWRNGEDPEDSPLKWLEADMQEFGERIAELAKVRKVMYFLFAFKDGAEAANLSCSVEFTADD